jgi:hypothetical protein
MNYISYGFTVLAYIVGGFSLINAAFTIIFHKSPNKYLLRIEAVLKTLSLDSSKIEPVVKDIGAAGE